MNERYPIPAAEGLVDEEFKASRFITILCPCRSETELKLVLTDVKRRYPGASHYCWAFLGGAPDDSVNMGSSDDGEPAGSAGRPMLATLQGSGLGEVAAVVTRFYGGTKLGVGGLVRAYTSGIKKALIELPTQMRVIMYPASLCCSYPQLADVEYLLEKHGASVQGREFAESVQLSLLLPRDGLAPLNLELASLSQGQLQIRLTL